ncbi:MAG TPA: hypothetical protein VJU87_04870 [Gemmatimonadaceae bacterium]|nr:hypothetical protein [Gemmatimonadaceae bacterium]
MRKLMIALVLTAVAAAACNDTTSPTTTVPGNYLLQTVNGSGVPMVAYQSPTDKLEVLYGRVLLNADLSFVDSTLWRQTIGSTASDTAEVYRGTYQASGDHILLTVNDGSTYSMTWQGRSLVYTDNSYSFVYKK